MIAWFGPAVLLVLLAASQVPTTGHCAGGDQAAVLAEEFGVAATRADTIEAPAAAMRARLLVEALPRELPRCRSVRGHGLPAPRAPSC